MVIELSFQNSKKMRRRVQIMVDYISIEEMIRENHKLLISLIERERVGTEYLEVIKNLDK